MKAVCIQAPAGMISGNISLPASKSIANRLLILNALSNAPINLKNLSESGDTVLLSKILENLVQDIDAGEAGTVFRFLAAYLSTKEGTWHLTGSSRMKNRPVGPLVDALRQAGAKVEWGAEVGFPPLIIHGKKLKGGKVTLDARISSQFVSAMLMIAPLTEQGLSIQLTGKKVSEPYIRMTIQLMKQMGASVNWTEDTIVVLPGEYSFQNIGVEKDWSSAAFWYELCALSNSITLELQDLHEKSIQGDCVIVEIMKALGVRTNFTQTGAQLEKTNGELADRTLKIDCGDFPDLVPALVCTCAGLGIEAQFSGLQTLQYKESDRISALKSELEKLGVVSSYQVKNDIFHVKAGHLKSFSGTLRTHNDHRIAMALAPLSMICGQVILDDGDVVEKSYPDFWEQLRSIGFSVENQQGNAERM